MLISQKLFHKEERNKDGWMSFKKAKMAYKIKWERDYILKRCPVFVNDKNKNKCVYIQSK